jgi:coenzyme F420-reducing hydrogenase beta subunit
MTEINVIMTEKTLDKNCTGCHSCKFTCPNECISIISDKEGFLRPSTDRDRCTECGICLKHCPQNNKPELSYKEEPIVLGARYKNNTLLRKSASGGIFIGVAKRVVEMGNGVVFGCAFDENLVAKHIYVENIDDLALCQSSKYVQSDVGITFLQAKEFLDCGKTVLFSGTPCQVAGLFAFLGKDYDSLVTIDFVCKGVPSPLLFKRYITKLEERLKEKVLSYNFRFKHKATWSSTSTSHVRTKNKTKEIIWSSDPYYKTFKENYSLRESCYVCKYANLNRVSDLTMADFWGIEATHTKHYDKRGVSAVFINTDKGERYFNDVSADYDIFISCIENVASAQHNLSQPSIRPTLRSVMYEGIENDDFDIYKSPCFRYSFRQDSLLRMKAFMPSSLSKFIKKMKAKAKMLYGKDTGMVRNQ